MNEVSKQIGQLFILGFPGDEPPPAFLEFISEEQVGGVILFAENCPTHQKTKENIDIIKAHLGSTKPFIAVDQEGGRVCRLRGAPAEYSSPWWYGSNDNINRFREDYSRSAVFMESIGINLNLSPVCDIFLNKETAVWMNDVSVIPLIRLPPLLKSRWKYRSKADFCHA